MKNVTYRSMMLVAAALAASVAPALAQGETRMKAEVPFAFRIGTTEYPAGSYVTSVNVTIGGTGILRLVNEATGEPRYAMATAPISTQSASSRPGEPRLMFRCAESECSLAQVWLGNSQPGVMFRPATAKSGETMKLAVVRLLPASAD